MSQRKLTGDELEKVMRVRRDVRAMCHWSETGRGPDFWYSFFNELGAMADHCTTDGQPYVEPEWPIPEGYRLAVAGDEGRSDCMVWCLREWRTRVMLQVGKPFCDQSKYIVPIDRTPTDDDAKSRPEVMVRDRDQQEWKKVRLVAVQSEGNQPFVTMGRSSLVTSWQQCRHLYPGE